MIRSLIGATVAMVGLMAFSDSLQAGAYSAMRSVAAMSVVFLGLVVLQGDRIR